jgi:hypothetical protein
MARPIRPVPLSAWLNSLDTFFGGHLPLALRRPLGELHIAMNLDCFLVVLGIRPPQKESPACAGQISTRRMEEKALELSALHCRPAEL